jgi:hypothetical protein
MMPIFSVLDGVEADVDEAAADDELLLFPPQAAIHSPHRAHTATAVAVRGSR